VIEPGRRIVDAIESVMAGSTADAQAVEGETRVLQSRGLAERVVDKLQLEKDPEFNSALRSPGPLARYLGPPKAAVSAQVAALKQWLAATLGGAAPEAREPTDPAERLRTKVVDAVLANLDVSVDGRSRVIGVTFTSESPEKAARIVNTLADLYIIAARLRSSRRRGRQTNGSTIASPVAPASRGIEAAAEQYRAERA
jgi:uncharacterized protein involved in exopolysaccharide biosynthesis